MGQSVSEKRWWQQCERLHHGREAPLEAVARACSYHMPCGPKSKSRRRDTEHWCSRADFTPSKRIPRLETRIFQSPDRGGQSLATRLTEPAKKRHWIPAQLRRGNDGFGDRCMNSELFTHLPTPGKQPIRPARFHTGTFFHLQPSPN